MAFRKDWRAHPKVEVSFPKSRIRPTKEAAKQNDEVPYLGISNNETRDSHGQLTIYLEGNGRKRGWVVVGKYAEPRADGNQFYVCDKRYSFFSSGITTYHEDLLMAVAHVTKLKEEFENADV